MSLDPFGVMYPGSFSSPGVLGRAGALIVLKADIDPEGAAVSHIELKVLCDDELSEGIHPHVDTREIFRLMCPDADATVRFELWRFDE